MQVLACQLPQASHVSSDFHHIVVNAAMKLNWMWHAFKSCGKAEKSEELFKNTVKSSKDEACGPNWKCPVLILESGLQLFQVSGSVFIRCNLILGLTLECKPATSAFRIEMTISSYSDCKSCPGLFCRKGQPRPYIIVSKSLKSLGVWAVIGSFSNLKQVMSWCAAAPTPRECFSSALLWNDGQK